ncbi:MAG: type VI secretion system baseplate subunit TssG [Chitinophagaceae bacterium]|nr:type VI secretion system baseplate subunit TssG [Chitinophagaceae bacterium]
MSNNTILNLLQHEIQSSPYDVKPEVQLLLAMEKGLLPDDFLMFFDKLFNREYSKDVVSSEVKEDARKQNQLHLHLSRSGFYDQLPEGLFFQLPQKSSKGMKVAEMAGDYKQNKKKEEDIRRFFLPFENDFFTQRLHLEREETMLLEGLKSGILNEYFIRFWNLPATIPKPFIIPLILLLPYAYKIAGDLGLTAESLGQLLREKVRLTKRAAGMQHAETAEAPALGEAKLGLDMVCGEVFWEGTPWLEIEIGPLKYSKVSDYIEGGRRFSLIETFNRFFIPAGVDVKVSIVVAEEEQSMLLEKGAEPVLGYSSVLGY